MPFDPPLSRHGTPAPSIHNRRSFSIRQSDWGPNVLLLDVRNAASTRTLGSGSVNSGTTGRETMSRYALSSQRSLGVVPTPPRVPTNSSSAYSSRRTLSDPLSDPYATASEDSGSRHPLETHHVVRHLDRAPVDPSTPSISLREKLSSVFDSGDPIVGSYPTASGTGRGLVPFGLGIGFLCGVASIVFAIFVLPSKVQGVSQDDPEAIIIQSDAAQFISLALDFMVLVCTETVGWVHHASLKRGLANEGRLRYNSHIRLITAVRSAPFYSLNAAPFNLWLAFLLVVSYSAAGATVMPSIEGAVTRSGEYEHFTLLVRPPFLVLGGALVLQALSGILLWVRLQKGQPGIIGASGSPIDALAALHAHGLVTRRPDRCMAGLTDANNLAVGPRRPSRRQPSIWGSGRTRARVVSVLVWALVAGGAIWIGVLLGMTKPSGTDSDGADPKTAFDHWSVLPNSPHDNPMLLDGKGWGEGIIVGLPWVMLFVIATGIQAVYTLLIHCAELPVNAWRDERIWRKATTAKGIRTTSPLLMTFATLPSFVLFVAKPVIHWAFSLTLAIWNKNGQLQMTMRPVQVRAHLVALIDRLILDADCQSDGALRPLLRVHHLPCGLATAGRSTRNVR